MEMEMDTLNQDQTTVAHCSTATVTSRANELHKNSKPPHLVLNDP